MHSRSSSSCSAAKDSVECGVTSDSGSAPGGMLTVLPRSMEVCAACCRCLRAAHRQFAPASAHAPSSCAPPAGAASPAAKPCRLTAPHLSGSAWEGQPEAGRYEAGRHKAHDNGSVTLPPAPCKQVACRAQRRSVSPALLWQDLPQMAPLPAAGKVRGQA